MRHVSNIIGSAIRDEVFVSWDEVNAKASLRGTQSNLPDDEALTLEQRLPLTCTITFASDIPDDKGKIAKSGTHKVGGLYTLLTYRL